MQVKLSRQQVTSADELKKFPKEAKLRYEMIEPRVLAACARSACISSERCLVGRRAAAIRPSGMSLVALQIEQREEYQR
jgi:ferredoxin